MTSPPPSVGRIVHYVSYGTPPNADGEQVYRSECRAAIVTRVDPYDRVTLMVANPTGVFFNEHVAQDESDHAGGTWHWPERVA